MTKDEIKKGLEVCTQHIYCKDCPYRNQHSCMSRTQQDALDLITEQEKEIERLRDDYARVQEPFAQYQMASDKEIKAQIKQAQIDILNKAKTNLSKSDDFMDICSWHIDKIIEEIEK